MRRLTADTGHLWVAWDGVGEGGKYSVISVNPDISQVRSMDPEDRVITGFHCTVQDMINRNYQKIMFS